MDGDEYLSRMKKADKFILVITVVAYYGEKPQDGAKSLHEMLNVSSETEQYVNDYIMLLVEVRQNDLMLYNVNNVDLFNLLGILLDKNGTWKETKVKALNYVKEREVDKSVVMAITGAANCKIDFNEPDKKEETVMYTVFEERAKESESKGEIRGTIKTYREVGLHDGEILEKIKIKFDLSEQEAEEYL